VTAVLPIAFKQAVGMLRRGGTCVLNGLPPGEFPVSIFDLVLNRYTLRGSIVGTRKETEQLSLDRPVAPSFAHRRFHCA
jgi:propanol-preferring alcohol dehydrogenase